MPAITASRAEKLPIGALSKRSGVNIETIRYYERVKMLAPPPRTARGSRVYDMTDLRILVFIRRRVSWAFRLMKSAPCCGSAGLRRRRVAKFARSQHATSKTFGPSSTTCGSWNDCCRRQ